MKDGPSIVRIAALIGDHARAEILTALMAGEALTATELAAVASLTKQTISAHLSKLLDAKLIAVESQGRHRYFRLADRDVAHLLETLMGVAFRTGALRARSSPREPALRTARVCYDHLAGDLGVLAFESLEQHHRIRRAQGALAVTRAGKQFFSELGVDVDGLASKRRSLSHPCLDWSVRRHHLGGAVGAALLSRCYELGWARRIRNSRVVSFTPVGERAFRRCFPVTTSS
jgi:DNA-binding transcriptional ArsR family regulator